MSRDIATPDVTEFIQCPYCNKDIGVVRSRHNCKKDLKHRAYVWPMGRIALRWTRENGWSTYDPVLDDRLMELEFYEVYNLVTQYPHLFKPEEA